MREIKFRAWNSELKKWEHNFEINPEGAVGKTDMFETYRLTGWVLMQFTGLKDAKGIEIYEGDLIDSYQNSYAPTEVYWDDSLACWATQNFHSTLALHNSMDSKTVIVGNIFENPELINN